MVNAQEQHQNTKHILSAHVPTISFAVKIAPQ